MNSICCVVDLGLVEYDLAWGLQKRLVTEIASGQATDYLLLLEHPHIYTIGRSGNRHNILLDDASLDDLGIHVTLVDRGGDVTYHGPGQLVAYPVIDLNRLGYGAVDYVRSLEEVLIRTLAEYGIAGRRVRGRTGVWVGDEKIAAIGVRLARGVTSHGFALNVDPDLSYFKGIIPCGLADAGVTSLARLLGRAVAMDDVKQIAVNHFGRVLGLTMLRADSLPSFVQALAGVGQ